MKEVLRTVDHLTLHFAQSVLREVGIVSHTLDRHMSYFYGYNGAFIPIRLVVADDKYETARQLLREAGLDDFLYVAT